MIVLSCKVGFPLDETSLVVLFQKIDEFSVWPLQPKVFPGLDENPHHSPSRRFQHSL